MRMIKPGIAKTSVFRGHCGNCRAEFEATPDELKDKIQHDPDPRDSGGRFARVLCTYCNKGTVYLWETRQ